MKLLSYSLNGRPSWGALQEDRILDLQAASHGTLATLRDALFQVGLDGIEQLSRGVRGAIELKDVQLLPVVPDAPRIFCVGLNYEDHRVEARRDKTGEPTIFLRVTSSQIGHGQPIVVPRESSAVDYEGEIAVVIGRGGRRIPEADAWSHVAGYAPYNDVSVRDWQAHSTQWTPGKNFPGTGAFGPWMVTRPHIADDQTLQLRTRLNGETVQSADTRQLIFPIPRLIAYISSFTGLETGDVIVTGTPGGVGFKRNPPLFLRPGDVVEVDVEGVGSLRNPVQAE